jgi:thioredoxin-dependent peroxiredoxin
MGGHNGSRKYRTGTRLSFSSSAILFPGSVIMFRTRAIVILALFAGLLAAAATQAQTSPAVGSTAPPFKLQDQNGKWHTLDEYKGKWLVLYFYPKDQTPGCTTEACEFRDNVFAFRDANAVIVGVSVDDVESHKKFETKNNLPFTLLADPTKEMTRSYGVLKKYMGTMELARRDTFLIDPNGRIAKIYRDVDPKGHSETVLTDLKAAKK